MISNEYRTMAIINKSSLQESPGISDVRRMLSTVAFGLLAVFKLIVLFISLQQIANAAPIYPLKVSANGRYLVDQSNIPFLISGDSPQALIGNLSESDADFFFANREVYGFNTMWINLLCNTGTRCDSSGNTYDGIPPFTTPGDLSTPNEAYFARADRMIQLAANHGMTVFLDPIETIGWLDILRSNGLTKARAYGQYLGNRYKNFDNIVWMSGNDFQNWKEQPSDDELVREVALGIKDYDTRHIHTVGLDYMVSSSLDNASWAPIIKLNAAYTYYPTYAEVLKGYNQSSTVPVFMVEAHYEFENGYRGNATLRRQEYWTNLSGATGQLYGHRDTWGFSSGWKNTFNTAGSAQMAIVKTFFDSHRWYELVPDQNHTTVIAGYGTFSSSTEDNADNRSPDANNTDINTNDYTTAARTPDGALVIAYMPTLRTLTVDMSQLSGPVTATWFDPSNGTYTPIAGSPFANTGTRQFTPPGNNHDGDGDWVLVLEGSPLPLEGSPLPPENSPLNIGKSDFAVTKIQAPKRVTITEKKPSKTKIVKVKIQNRSPYVETITNTDLLTKLVTLQVESLATCPAAAIMLPTEKLQDHMPLKLKPKKQLSVSFLVTFDCVNDKASGAGHEDFRYLATVNSSALDGKIDVHPDDDSCPYSVAAPYIIDPYPNGKIKDKGCGARKPDGSFGADILTDIISR